VLDCGGREQSVHRMPDIFAVMRFLLIFGHSGCEAKSPNGKKILRKKIQSEKEEEKISANPPKRIQGKNIHSKPPVLYHFNGGSPGLTPFGLMSKLLILTTARAMFLTKCNNSTGYSA
jgi:hypothetical protein